MATTITAATLTITHTEKLEINGVDVGVTNTQTIQNVKTFSHRVVPIQTTEAVVIAIGTVIAAGQFVESDVKYIRLTNLDNTNFITLVFRNEDANEFAIKLDFGQTFIFNGDLSGGVVDTMDASATALTVSLADLVDITALADTAECDLEYWIGIT